VTDGSELAPGSPLPQNAREMDLLLRRVPEVALLPEFRSLRFSEPAHPPASPKGHAARVAKLADAAFLERLRESLVALEERASKENNGGLRFVASSLRHFVASLPAERHPLVVALYFLSLAGGDRAAESPEILAIQMDDYESGL
jgi:hypothetical protein